MITDLEKIVEKIYSFFFSVQNHQLKKIKINFPLHKMMYNNNMIGLGRIMKKFYGLP